MKIVKAALRVTMIVGLVTMASSFASAQTIARVQSADTPFASSAAVHANARLIFLSGIVASPLNPANPTELGNTTQQTQSILTNMKAQLESLGSSMANVVKVTVFQVGIPENEGRMDRPAMNEVFQTFFGSAQQQKKPTRSTVQVAGLGHPGVLVEIEAIAAELP